MDKNILYMKIKELRHKFGFHFTGLAEVIGGKQPFLAWVRASGNISGRFRQIALAPGRGIAGGVYQQEVPMIIQDTREELVGLNRVDYPIVLAEALISLMAVPVWHHGQVSGILLMAYRQKTTITAEAYHEVMSFLQGPVGGYEIQYVPYDRVIHPGQQSPMEVPIYELVNYHMISAREDERHRIAREIHDGVIQNIVGIQFLLRALKYQRDPEQLMYQVDEIDFQLGQVEKELRSLSVGLFPAALDDLGLAAALNSYFEWMRMCHYKPIVFDQTIADKRYASEVELAFYRVCQEAVNNACKYADSSQIWVSLSERENRLVMLVSDDGRGFDMTSLTSADTGLGIAGMQARAELIDGDFSCCSAPGEGTRIYLSVWVGEDENDENNRCG